jgi:hypothetical protein
LVATAVTLPVMVIAAVVVLAVSGGGDSGTSGSPAPRVLPPLTPSAPPHAAAESRSCTRVLEQLPVQLGKLSQRIVHPHPDTPFVVAWGDPPVVLACGVDRPKTLRPGSSEQAFNAGDLAGPYYFVSRSGDANVYTIIDRQPYISITVPGDYQAGDLLPVLVGAVGKALPPVCSTDPTTPDLTKLCTRRP